MTTDEKREMGFIPLWRSIEKSDVFLDEKLFKCWVICMFSASTRTDVVVTPTGSVPIKRGDFVFSRRKFAKRLGKPESTVRNLIEKLKNQDRLLDVTLDRIKDRNVDRRYVTILQVKNYDQYALSGPKSGPKSGPILGPTFDANRSNSKPDARGRKEKYSPNGEYIGARVQKARAAQKKMWVDDETGVVHTSRPHNADEYVDDGTGTYVRQTGRV